jgi:pilus assembly protein Flp/PilA
MINLYVSLQNMLERLGRNEEGQTAVEYGLVLALIAVVIVVAMAGLLGGVATTVVGKITTALAA